MDTEMMSKHELILYLKNAILAYEHELENQDYDSPEELHAVVLNELEMEEKVYKELMGPYSW